LGSNQRRLHGRPGKSHTATAIDVQAIEHHRRKVRCFSTVELVNALEQEKALGKAGKLAEMLTKVDLRAVASGARTDGASAGNSSDQCRTK